MQEVVLVVFKKYNSIQFFALHKPNSLALCTCAKTATAKDICSMLITYKRISVCICGHLKVVLEVL
jgi:hypothetical protein